MVECNAEDILCQMQALAHLRGLKSTLGDERFKSIYPELEGLDERLTDKISSQEVSLKESLERCGLSQPEKTATMEGEE